MSETKVCGRCESPHCGVAKARLQLQAAGGDDTISHSTWVVMADCLKVQQEICLLGEASKKSYYKARAEAAEGKVERVRELANGYAAHQYTGGGDYGTGAEETFHSVADDILEALNGK